MSDLPIGVGDIEAQERFIRENALFLHEYANLYELLNRVFLRTLSFPSHNDSDGPSSEDAENAALAQLAVFYLGRIAADDFGELLTLAGNGRGVGAYKILRGMYERIVTAAFIAKSPSEARIFLEHADYQRGQIWTRAVEVMPEIAQRHPPEKIQEMLEAYEVARLKLKSTQCSRCGQPITHEAWTRRTVETMAEKAGPNLKAAYVYCYLIPTFHSHPTSWGLEARLRVTESGAMSFKETTEADASMAVFHGHGLVLRLLDLQNQFFALGLSDEVERRVHAFQRVWDRADAEGTAAVGESE